MLFNNQNKEPEEPKTLDQEIENLEKYIRNMDFRDPDYNCMLNNLKTLYEIKEQAAKAVTAEKANDKKGLEVSGDTLVKVGGYILIGTLVIFKEQLIGPIASKAFAMMKLV